MDILAHYLWTVAMYWQYPKRWLVGLFGVMPDILSFGFFFVGEIGHLTSAGPPPIESLPSWIFSLYALTHSFIPFLIVFAILFFWKREWSFLILGWPLHILIDIPTHSTEYFPTPFLWPIADVQYNGLPWVTGWFLLLTYIALIGVYAWLLFGRVWFAKKFAERTA